MYFKNTHSRTHRYFVEYCLQLKRKCLENDGIQLKLSLSIIFHWEYFSYSDNKIPNGKVEYFLVMENTLGKKEGQLKIGQL